MIVLIFQTDKLVLQRLMFTRSRLQANFSVSIIDLKLLSTAHFVLVGLDELGLSLLMSSVLLFIVADLVVKLLEVVLESDDFVLGSTNCVL